MARITRMPTAAERAYEDILRRISDRILKAGDPLPEASLAADLGVSRTPVREALRRLEQEGIAVLIAGGGARLATPSRKEMGDAMEVRIYLERIAVRKLAPAITPLQICRLEETIQEQQIPDRELPFLLQQDIRFHHLLAEATGNEALTDSIDLILARSSAFRILFAGKGHQQNRLIAEEHDGILEALRRHDGDLAEKRLTAHLEIATAELTRSMETARGKAR